MLYNEFIEYMKENASSSLNLFLEKATDFQLQKNKNRTGKAKWNEAKVQRAINSMYEQLLDNAYQKIKSEKGLPKLNGTQIWIDFMEENEFLDMFADAVSDLEFE